MITTSIIIPYQFPILSCFWYRWWLPGIQHLLKIHVTHACQVHKDALFLNKGGGNEIDWSWNSVLSATKLITCNFLWQKLPTAKNINKLWMKMGKPQLKSIDLKKEEWSSREVSYRCSHLFPCGSPISSEGPLVWQHNLGLNWPIFFVVDIIIAGYAILYNTTILETNMNLPYFKWTSITFRINMSIRELFSNEIHKTHKCVLCNPASHASTFIYCRCKFTTTMVITPHLSTD
jgi:hypothetical protein